MSRTAVVSTFLLYLSLVSGCQTTGFKTGGMSEAEEEAMFTVAKKPMAGLIEIRGTFGRDWTFGAARERVREICRAEGLVYADDFEAEQINIREIMGYTASCRPAT